MKPSYPSRGGLVVGIPTLVAFVSPLSSAPVVWDNSNATGAWSTGANWDTNVEPTAADDVTFPLGLGGTITTTTTENALSLTFNDAYTLSGGTLALATGNSISVADGVTATINNALNITGGLSKTGTGTLVLGGSNTNPGGTVISAGKIRAANAGALGTTGIVTTVNGGTILEVASGITLDRPITLMHGGTVAGLGTATSNGKITINAAATSVTLSTDQASDVFSVGNGANDLTGGSLVAGTTVIGIAGPGAVRLGAASDFDGSWSIPSGRLELGAAAALGDQAGSSVTLSGGTLSARLATATTFTGPAGNLIVTADSALISDRSTVGAGVTHTLGVLSMGSNALTVAPGANATSVTAGIVLGNVTLTGNPTFAVNDSGATNGKLTTGSLVGGAVARTITKTGAGDLSITGGSTDLPSGSTFTSSGGGTIEMLFPNLGAAATVAVSAAQNPFGEASISVTGGSLRLLADGSGTTAVQTYQVPAAITLGGTVSLDPDRRSGSNTSKTFELPGITLAAGTTLEMAGDNTHGVRLTGPLALSGDAILKGVDTASKDGLLTLNGGIAGGVGDDLTVNGGTSPINLTIAASSTYGGGTVMNAGNVTLNAASAFGTGPTTLNGGSLVVNTDGALNGTVTVTGGTLRVNDTNALAANPVTLNGGTLDFRNNTTATITTGTLTVSGTSGISIGNNGSGSSQTFDFPQLDVSGDTVLTVTPVTTSFVPNFLSIDLAGNLTLSNTNTARVQTITEDAFPRTLIKAGIGTLEMEAASSHSGGTEVTAGILLVENAGALGSGALTLGATSGTATATAQFNSSLTVPNNLVVRSGGSGTLTFDAPAGGVTWNGGLSLQKGVTVDNGSASVPSTFNGVISGTGTITKISAGEIVLGNAANSFTGTLAINDGTLSVASDGALGDPANGVTLAGDAVLKIDSTFATSRTITSGGTTNSVSVSGANEFTVNSPLGGAGSFIKSGTGILTIAPGVDSSARSGATSGVTGGTLRVQGVKNLSDTGILTLNGSSGTIEFLLDADTVFPHPVTADGTGTLHVDRAIGGVASNGRHTLGTLGMVSGTLTVTGANGYGLSFGAATVSSNNTITNNAPGALRIASFTGNPGSSNLFVTFAGSGDIEITGAITEGAGTGNYGIGKNGPGTLRFGSSVTEFGRFATIQDGTLDLNGLTYPVSDLNLGGLASVSGATIVTGASGSLVLGGDVFFDAITTGQAGALLSGNLDLGAASRNFNIENNATAAADFTIDGPIGGSPGAAILKSGAGTLRLAGAGNTQPGLVSVTAGVLELAKSSGDAIGAGGLATSSTGIVRLAASEQISNSAAVSIGAADESFLELASFTETVGPLTITQSDANDFSGVKTGATGTLVLNGNLTFNNNANSTGTDGREVLITGTGSEFTPATDGTLDLGGVTRTIHVATTTVGANEPRSNATIETRIINGGILKTGPRTLNLTNPNNTFAGGLQIAGGTVKSGGGSSLGLGPVTFTNGAGVAAGLDFGTLTGTVADALDLDGAGDVTITYSALAPNSLVLSGGMSMTGNLIFDVVNGGTNPGDSAVLDVTGLLDDGTGTAGVTKIGNGTLKLAAGNTFSGSTTIQKGILSVAADSALGDTDAALTLNGGCLQTAASFSTPRDLLFGTGGGSVRVDSPALLEVAGDVTWNSGTAAFFGSGSTVLSGTTAGTGGDLLLGSPTAFATVPFSSNVGLRHVLSLRGSSALPAGNLSITNFGVLELGSGNFTRALGTGPGEVQLPTSAAGGWAAHGADRSVNLGGTGVAVVWGTQSPPFLAVGSSTGDLVLGSATGTHTVDFQNPIELNNGATSFFRDLVVNDGPAAIDARISGGISQSADPNLTFTSLDFEVTGTLDISGPMSGEIGIDKLGTGTVILSGTNTFFGDRAVYEGTLRIAGNASWGTPQYVYVETGATLDASAMTTPITIAADEFISIYGSLLGDVATPGYFEGNGLVDGNVHAQAGAYVYPDFDGLLQVTGDFTLDATAFMDFYLDSLVPQTGFNRMRVGGTVNLAGELFISVDPTLVENDSAVLILNDGSDPITGTFAGLPEGAGIPIGNGLALQVTYLANGDGGAVGNDFGVTVVPDTFSTDLALSVDAPLAVDFLSNFTVTYTVENLGPANSTGSTLNIPLPGNAVFVGSTPAGTVNAGTLTIPVPAVALSATTTVTVQFTAPATEAAILVEPLLTASGIDGNGFNNEAPSMTAVMAGGCLTLASFVVDEVNDELSLGIDTIPGVSYVLQRSTGLDLWDDYWFFEGDGGVETFVLPMSEPREFFRFNIVPYGGGGGGGEVPQ